MSIALDEGERLGRAERQTGGDPVETAIEPVHPPRDLASEATSRPDRIGARAGRQPLAWPDKVGLVIAFYIGALSAIACVVVLLVSETTNYGRLNQTLAAWSGMAELGIALPAWLLMRTIDFVTGGPKRRRRRHMRR